MFRQVSLAIASLVALVVGASVALAADDGSSQRPPSTGSAHAAVDGIAPGLPELIGAFDREPNESDRIPGAAPNEALQQAGDGQPGETPDMARSLGAPGWDAYAWPMNQGVCYSIGLRGGCAELAVLDRGVIPGVSYRRTPNPMWTISGLANDAVSEIRIRLESGRHVDATIIQNVFIATTETAPASIEWSNASGDKQSLPIPRDLAR